MADPTRSRRRVRNLLSNYYGVGDNAEGNAQDISDIDVPAFQAPQYVENLIQNSTLSDLLTRDNSMVSEIKCLDSDMQMLVYENYNKFISATDTIRKMKEKVETMEGNMDRLSSSMEKISDCSNSINSNLSDHRVQIEDLQGVRQFLKRLQFLSELPQRMNHGIDLGAYAQAVKHYNNAHPFLNSFTHITTFAAIRKDAEAARKRLLSKLHDRMGNDELRMSELSECVGLLLDLKEPGDHLRKEFFERRKAGLSEHLESTEYAEEKSSLDFINSLNGAFLADFNEFVKSYKSLFLRTEDADAAKQLDVFTKQTFTKYFAIVKERFGATQGEDASIMISALGSFAKNLQETHVLVPSARLCDRAAEITEGTVRHEVNRAFVALQLRVNETIVAGMIDSVNGGEKAQNAPSLSSVVGIAAQQFVREIEAVLFTLESVVATAKKSLDTGGTFVSLVYVHVRQFFETVDETMLNYTGVAGFTKRTESQVPPIFVLMLTRFSMELKATIIAQVLHKLSQCFPLEGETQMTMLNFEEMAKRANSTTQKLLASFVEIQGQSVTQMLRKGVEAHDWMMLPEPSSVRKAIEMIVTELELMESSVGQIFPDEPKAANDGTGRQGDNRSGRQAVPTRGTGRTNALEKDIKRLFQKKVKVFGTVEFTRCSIVNAVLKVSVKSLFELCRLKEFSTHGFQQMLIDVNYMRMSFRGLGNDDSSVQTLLDEVVTSCSDRCREPVLLDQAMVDNICEATAQAAQQASDQ